MTAAHAIVYGAQAPAALAPKLPNLAALARGTRGAVNSSHVTISTRGVGGNPTLSTTSFVKSPLFLENIYEVSTPLQPACLAGLRVHGYGAVLSGGGDAELGLAARRRGYDLGDVAPQPLDPGLVLPAGARDALAQRDQHRLPLPPQRERRRAGRALHALARYRVQILRIGSA